MMKVVLALMTFAIIAGVGSAATHVVGDRTGWSIPPSASFYSDWASRQTFQVGDILVFNFPNGAHTVGEVSKSGYDSCTTTNTLTAVKTSPPANYTLTRDGSHYFLCTIAAHCSQQGQKLAITVGSSSSPTAAPEQPPTVPTAGEPIPSSEGPSTGGSTPPPPGSNSASSTVAGVSMLSLMALTVAALF